VDTSNESTKPLKVMNENRSLEQFADDYRIAVHELGHYEVCASFGFPASPKVFEQAERYSESDGKIIAGHCEMDCLAKTSPFQKACIGWGGYLAEHICGVTLKSCRNPFPLKRETLRDFYNAAFVGFEENFSRSDQSWICSSPDKLRSFKSAYKRLRRKTAKIKRLAKTMAANISDADRSAKTTAALRDFFRRQNEATHEDFLRLVCGNDAARFERFISSKAESQLSNSPMDFADTEKSLKHGFLAGLTNETRAKYPGKNDDEIAEIQFAAELLGATDFMRREYGSGFKSEAKWLARARDFLNWAASEKRGHP